jgi:hypothetical protein
MYRNGSVYQAVPAIGGNCFCSVYGEEKPCAFAECRTSRAALGQLLEEALLDLPEQYRIVVMLRDVEELSTSETAAALDLTEHNVKVRLHRGRAMARGWLFALVGANAKRAFPFMGVRCDGVVQGVFARLRELGSARRRYTDAPRSNPRRLGIVHVRNGRNVFKGGRRVECTRPLAQAGKKLSAR